MTPNNDESTSAKRTVLVVDDDADLLKVAIRVLKLHGYEAVGATSCEDALALIEEHDVDLLLTDVQMPGMDGNELASRMGVTHPDLRILFTSGYPNEVLQPANGEAGQAVERKHFIEKPYAMSDLARRVEEVFAADPPSH